MKCIKCGTELENNALVCPFCGQVVSDETRVEAQAAVGPLTKKDFLKLPAMKSCKGNINLCGILLYILGAINIVFQIVSGNFLPVDGVVMILLGLGIHLGKSRVCALLCLAYSIFNLAVMLMTTGVAGGIWILLIAIDAVTYTFKYQSAWNKYLKEGVLPVEKDKK